MGRGLAIVIFTAMLLLAGQASATEEKVAALEAEESGICGPTAIAAIALFPLGLYRVYKRRR